ncbi:hypothetical protein JI666_09330 [Bacillus sp. NTK071]|uniref:Uncharacterized protein n=1 Tax=Guptibacillus hwajinpoensis TaxID=208199 RepID=A0A4U1MLW4_9BACL|nr:MULTISPECIES: hypothetical protein [Bacillaceae]MBN8208946.1 hypothetical protein [Bacillus sp. NTK071]TKD72233.1 hypothetical protein FBF83_05420 [Pseudalkalibacillus hwajinpoensis]
MNGNNDTTYDKATTEEAITTAKSYMINNFSVENVALGEPYQTEMGGMAIDGTVNNDEKFTININEDFTVDGLAIRSKNFPPRKKGCEEKVCEY